MSRAAAEASFNAADPVVHGFVAVATHRDDQPLDTHARDLACLVHDTIGEEPVCGVVQEEQPRARCDQRGADVDEVVA